MNEKNFQQAIENPSYRQKFLDKIDLAESSLYIKYLEYNPVENIFTLMKTIPPNSPRKKSQIIIYPVSFSREYHPAFQDFLCTLIDHEGWHAKENYFFKRKHTMLSIEDLTLFFIKGKKPLSQKREAEATRLLYKSEMRAYANQLRKAKVRGISEQYKKAIEEKRSRYIKAVNSLDQFLLKSQFISLFPLFNLIEEQASINRIIKNL